MQAEGIGMKSSYRACLALSAILAAVVAGQTAVGAGQSGTTSVLDRVQREEDPELSELIRLAVANRRSVAKVSDQEVLDLVRKVTQSYAQIKLLDQQIEQVAQKLKATAGPAPMQSELLLAKAELESKRMTELANLREVMGVVPKFPFEKKPTKSLSTWLDLNLIDERVYVIEYVKPPIGYFSDYYADCRWKSAGLQSETETLDYLRGRLTDPSKLPIRIEIHHKAEKAGTAEDLRAKIIALAKEANSQMDTEVRTELSVWVGSGESLFCLRQGKVYTFYPAPVQRPDGGSKRLLSGLANPEDLEQSILWRLTKPKNVPLMFRVEYDEVSASLARQVAETTKAVAQRLGIAELVGVKEVLVEPVPEAAFLGRWKAIKEGKIREIEVQPQGQTRLTMTTGPQTTVSAPWTLGTKEIFIDTGRSIVWRGYINAEGNLVIDEGSILPQGSWGGQGLALTVLAR